GGGGARAAQDRPSRGGRARGAPPRLPRTVMADLMGAERAVTAALALLLARRPSYVEVSLAEVADALAAPLRAGLTEPGGMLGGGLPVYGLYEASDGWVAVAALEPGFREALASSLGVELTRAALETAFRSRTTVEWEEWALDNDLPIVGLAQ